MALLVAALFLFLLYAVLIKFYEHWWRRLPEFQIKSPGSISISVVVAARNEEHNLPALLSALEKQDYPREQLELIVVDDDSTDRTAEIIYAADNVKLIKSTGGSKKSAIEAGIKTAIGELIVTTDADCIPPSTWLSVIAAYYASNKSAFIAAPVSYRRRKGLLHYFQSLDFLILQGITASSVSAKFHSMCNGANLAYEKKAFFEVDGFKGIDHIASGDDMLLMHKVSRASPDRVHYLKSKCAIVETNTVDTWKEFFWQRMRWASKSSHYGDLKIFLALILVYLFNLAFVVLAIAGIWDHSLWSAAVVLWIAKTAIELPFVHSIARFYEQGYLIPWFFLMQPLHIIYTVVVGMLSQFSSYSWKGRQLK